MGRPPCCDKVGIKKGPWTPEEDIILVSYIQEHGPGNWRSVPTNTGLLRCSKSCRLRWTNYLRPGIKRGNFTPHEEGMIIHLQALLGNKWAAIASYLPQRTDNDIKNYWNTHLKKKMKKLQTALEPQIASSDSASYQFVSKSFIDHKRTIDTTSCSSHASSSTTYASSTENISRLLEGWMRSSPKTNASLMNSEMHQNNNNLDNNSIDGSRFASASASASACASAAAAAAAASLQSGSRHRLPKSEQEGGAHLSSNEVLEPPLSFLENWLLGESVGQVEEMMELPAIF